MSKNEMITLVQKMFRKEKAIWLAREGEGSDGLRRVQEAEGAFLALMAEHGKAGSLPPSGTGTVISMDKRTAKLTIPGTLPGLNEYITAERSNRYQGAALKRQAEHTVTLAIRRCLRGVKLSRPVYMAYHWHEPTRRRDKDNVSSFGRKVIQDALVRAKVLQNDGWANIDDFSDRFAVDKGNPRIEVLIYEREEV